MKSRWPNVVAFFAAILVAMAMAFAFTGCIGDGNAARIQARRDVATVLRVAYDVGGKAAVAAKIDALVDDGKLTPAQGEALKAFAAEACEEMLRRLDGGEVGAIDCTDCYDAVTNAVECVDGCTDCYPSGDGGDGVCGDCGEKGTGGGDAGTGACTGGECAIPAKGATGSGPVL